MSLERWQQGGGSPPPPVVALAVPRPLAPLVMQPQRPLEEHLKPFLGWFKFVRQRAPNTIAAYGRDLRAFTGFCAAVGVQSPEHVTFQVVEVYMAWLQHERKAQPTTANRHRAAIIALFVYLTRNGFAATNPARDTFSLKEPKRLLRYLTVPEQERVLAALAEDRSPLGWRDLALVGTALLAGLRCEELSLLRVQDLDFETSVLRVECGKGAKDRELPLIPRLAAILRPYLADARPRLTGGRPVPWVFVNGSPSWTRTRLNHPRQTPTRLDRPLCTRSIFGLVREKVSPLVGRPVHPHMLRHSFGSRLRAAGADLQLIQEAMGHSSITTTTIYAHLATPQRLADLTRLLA